MNKMVPGSGKLLAQFGLGWVALLNVAWGGVGQGTPLVCRMDLAPNWDAAGVWYPGGGMVCLLDFSSLSGQAVANSQKTPGPLGPRTHHQAT